MTGSLYALANKASPFTVGVMMALFALVPMLIAVRAGRWLDRVGPWKPLGAGAALLIGGTLLPLLFSYEAADIAPLLVAACLIGTGATLLQLTVQNLVGHQTRPDNRAVAFSWLAMGASVASFVGPVASGILIDGFGHRATYAVLLLAALGVAALLWVNRGILPSHDRGADAVLPPPMFDLFRLRDVRNVLIAGALISMAWDLQNFMVPVYGTYIGLSAAQIGLVLGSFSAATFVVRLAMPWLSRTFREWQVLTFALAAAAAAFTLMPFSTALSPLLACAFLLGLGLGSAQPNLMSLIHAHTPAGRVGEALGVRTTVMNGSHVVLPLVFGAFGTIVGAAAVFWVMAIVLAAGSRGAWLRARKRA
jgi:MFS family permease